MRLEILTCAFLNCTSLLVTAQNRLYSPDSYGTYLVALISKSGIVVGADSRSSNCENGDGSPVYAYVDGVQKIFRYKTIFFQIAGAYDYGNYTICGLFDMFNKSNQQPVNVHNFWPVFCAYAKAKMTPSDYNNFKIGTECIISGYDESTACAYFYDPLGIDDSIINKGFLSNFKAANHSAKANHIYEPFLDTAHIESMISLAKGTIEYTANYQKKGISNIGGPSSIGYITNSGKFYENFQKKYCFKTVREEMMAAYNDQIHRCYRTPKDSVNFKDSIHKFLSGLSH